ncbi:Clp protease N-terminal domain-containing protein [Actinoplanes sp. NPDC026619]|uniref:Clp protease N-terminal domain-containing protein n=1 Tax=Actinoplanes sp. NPDC026619 TaxID=3155798 RepID=UPI0033C9580B
MSSFLSQILAEAAEQARTDGSTTIEAHHLLLALAHDGAAAGLDHATIRAALDREFTHSLAAAGVHLTNDLPPATPTDTTPHLGATAKAAIERAVTAAHHIRDTTPAHLLLGILQTPAGTVPRALHLAGINRDTLTAAVRRETNP